jgi:hypothetical protein
MNLNTLARHYENLTPEERFRLVLAADARGDKAQRARVAAASPTITRSGKDYVPFFQIFDLLSLGILLELLEAAADYRESLFGDSCAEDPVRENAGDEHAQANELEAKPEDDTAEEKTTEADAQEAAGGGSENATELPYSVITLVKGFVLKVKAAGWALFCERLTIPPFARWGSLPCLRRLLCALAHAERAAFTPEQMLAWLNASRPAGTPALTEMKALTPEKVAKELETSFHELVRYRSG